MDKPTPKQLRYLKRLAERTGGTFAWPQTKAEASREIERLKGRPSSARSDVVRDRRAVSRELGERGGAAAVRPNEVSGYGSSARWAGGRP